MPYVACTGCGTRSYAARPHALIPHCPVCAGRTKVHSPGGRQRVARQPTTRVVSSPSIETMNPADLRAQLNRLHEELIEAELAGLTSCDAYMTDLDQEIAECWNALVLASVTERAVARAQLDGALVG